MPKSDRNLPKSDRPAESAPERVGFLLIPGFALMSYASAIEPLRAANQLAGRELYDWRHVSTGEAEIAASNGVAIAADHRVGDGAAFDTVFVCAGGNPAEFAHRPTLKWLRGQARRGVRLGGVSGGPFILARAGLLAGHRCTIHWEHIPAFVEQFPELEVERSLYVIDRDRLTSAGGIAALDLMHALIEHDHGPALAAAVSEWFLHTEVRSGSGPQRMTLRERFGTGNARLLKALERMEARLEEPASRAELAAAAGVSVRQLERLFAAHLRSSVGQHYRRIRLDRARLLLRQTAMPILEVAVACGFASPSHFSRAYRRRFGQAPRTARGSR